MGYAHMQHLCYLDASFLRQLCEPSIPVTYRMGVGGIILSEDIGCVWISLYGEVAFTGAPFEICLEPFYPTQGAFSHTSSLPRCLA